MQLLKDKNLFTISQQLKHYRKAPVRPKKRSIVIKPVTNIYYLVDRRCRTVLPRSRWHNYGVTTDVFQKVQKVIKPVANVNYLVDCRCRTDIPRSKWHNYVILAAPVLEKVLKLRYLVFGVAVICCVKIYQQLINLVPDFSSWLPSSEQVNNVKNALVTRFKNIEIDTIRKAVQEKCVSGLRSCVPSSEQVNNVKSALVTFKDKLKDIELGSARKVGEEKMASWKEWFYPKNK